ncbi:MAG: hypothetical protein ABUL69_04840 [Peristeroidobacter soli]
MNTSSIVTLISAAAVAFGVVFAMRDASVPVAESRPPQINAAAKPMPLTGTVPHDSRDRSEQLTLDIERALVSNNPQQRETAFNVLLPELLESEPARVIALVARQQGETRDAIRDEVVRLWTRKDQNAAILWMGSIENEGERKASATVAMRTLAAIEPAQAVSVADQFGVGRDDGSLEHIVQIWATENLDASLKWLETQPDNAQTAQLRARIEHVQEQRLTARQ